MNDCVCVCVFCVSCFDLKFGGHCRPYKSRSHFTPPVLGHSSAYMKHPLPTFKFSGSNFCSYVLSNNSTLQRTPLSFCPMPVDSGTYAAPGSPWPLGVGAGGQFLLPLYREAFAIERWRVLDFPLGLGIVANRGADCSEVTRALRA